MISHKRTQTAPQPENSQVFPHLPVEVSGEPDLSMTFSLFVQEVEVSRLAFVDHPGKPVPK